MSKATSRNRGLAYELGRACGALEAALPLIRNQRARAYIESARTIIGHVVETRDEPAPKRAPYIRVRANSTDTTQGSD